MSTAASADVGSSTQTSSMLYNSALEKCVQFKQHQQDLLFFLYSLTCLVQAAEVSRYQKGKTNLDFTEETSEWQWHQLGSASLHLTPDSTPPLNFLQTDALAATQSPAQSTKDNGFY